MTIKLLIDIITSKRDINGNCYHAATITRVSDGERLTGIIDGPSNARGWAYDCGYNADEMHESEQILAIRKFNAVTRKYSYLERNRVKDFLRVSA